MVLVGGGKVGGGDAGEVEGLGEDTEGGGVVSSDAASKCATLRRSTDPVSCRPLRSS